MPALFGSFFLKGQNTDSGLKLSEIETLKKQAVSIVMYFGGSLNMLGNPETPRSEKDIIINESYSKIFLSSEVQIEDDLLENRQQIVYKSVQAYLKDVVFFYKKVEFIFNTEKVDYFRNTSGEIVFKVSLTRIIKGVNIDNKAVTGNMSRFVELNYNPQDKSLRIVGIYTNKLNEKQELTQWWNALSGSWKIYFRRKINFTGEPNINTIKKIISLSEIDISGIKKIQNIEALLKFRNLRKLDISGTNISNLMPIRNAVKLEYLACNNTFVTDLSYLFYANSLKTLQISATGISDISILKNMQFLKTITANKTYVFDISVLKNCKNIENIDFSNSKIHLIPDLSTCKKLKNIDLSNNSINKITGISNLQSLETLNLENTGISKISSLKTCKKLKDLYLTNTLVSDLFPVSSLRNLEKIYCDNSKVKYDNVLKFHENNSKCLIIYNSEKLLVWWGGLSYTWRKIFSEIAGIKNVPDKEKLHKVTLIQILDISRNKAVVSLSGLDMLTNLRKLDCNRTGISDLSPLKKLKKLEYFNCYGTGVSDLSPLGKMASLKTLVCSGTKVSSLLPIKNLIGLELLYIGKTEISDLSPLYLLKNIKTIYADDCSVSKDEALNFIIQNPRTLLIFRTAELMVWWESLPENWKKIFSDNMRLSLVPTASELEMLVRITDLKFITGKEITTISPLKKMIFLEKLEISNTSVTDLSVLADLKSLRILTFIKSPASNIMSIVGLYNLEKLNLSETPVDDLEALSGIVNLKKLNISNTPVKSLNDLKLLTNIINLDCSGTFVRNLRVLETNKKIKILKCYNTKLSANKVATFMERHPDCKVTFY